MIHVLIDITEEDIEIFKALVYSNSNDMVKWSYESEQGTLVNITFRKEPDENI